MQGEFYEGFGEYLNQAFKIPEEKLNVNQLLNDIVRYSQKTITIKNIINNWEKLELEKFDFNRPIKRFEIAVLIDYYLKPFETKQINHHGSFINTKSK